jgi:hypothetical protein
MANKFCRQRRVRDAIVFLGLAQEKAQASPGRKSNEQFPFDRDKTVLDARLRARASPCSSQVDIHERVFIAHA